MTRRLFLLSPWLAVVLLGAFGVVAGDSDVRLACTVLPNGQVALLPGPECPLPPMSQVVGVSVAGREDLGLAEALALARARAEAPLVAWGAGADARWTRLPVERRSRAEIWRAFAVALVASLSWACIPLAWVGRSRSAAAPPFVLFYAGVGAFAFRELSRIPGTALDRAELVSLLLSAGALAHLALAFPSSRELLVRFPRLKRLPYVALAFVLPVALVAFHSNAMVWAIGVRLSAVGFLALWAALLAAAMRVAREAGDRAAGVQARIFLWASAILALLPLPLVAGQGNQALGLSLAIAIAPLPLGFAASRYPVHDLGLDARRGLARALLYAVASALGAGVFGFVTDPGAPALATFFGVAFAVAGCFDGLRFIVLRRLEHGLAPEIERLASRSEAFAQEVATLRPEADIAWHLAREARGGLPAHEVSVVRFGEDGRTIDCEGPLPCPTSIADARSLLERRTSVLLPALDPPLPAAADRLLQRGFCMIAALATSGQIYAVVFVVASTRARPYRGIHASYLSTLGAHAGVGIRNARVGEALIAAERRAAAGRAALAMAHDVGKELDWIRRLAARLPDRVEDRVRFERDAGMIRELADDLATAVRARVREAGRTLASQDDEIALSEVVDRVAAKAGRAPGSGLVVNLDAAVRETRVSPDAEFVIGAVVDNALGATAWGTAVHLYADSAGGAPRISVRDHGPGPSEAARWLEPGWSGKAISGSGVGLSLAREMMRGLGGGLYLEAAHDGGTRAVMEFPCTD